MRACVRVRACVCVRMCMRACACVFRYLRVPLSATHFRALLGANKVPYLAAYRDVDAQLLAALGAKTCRQLVPRTNPK